ncbi:deoxyribonuclease-1-like 1 isoform X2 [Peromyscus californicus insignis]|uniref:deoxyribonuclease-1-like 1 isoform X2 n=1 Tax=Peromyscus californicus insignis TaxID=564181 RepID=UPI0022A789BD|nr:deoxyribonuclease-1-like 1 isoform X2 [Peromyscus californicus insignis]
MKRHHPFWAGRVGRWPIPRRRLLGRGAEPSPACWDKRSGCGDGHLGGSGSGLPLFPTPSPYPGWRCDSVKCFNRFKAERLTLAKVAKEPVMDTLVQILTRCDIMVLQEVVDSSQKTVSFLLRELNRFDGSRSYSFLNSSLLGRSTYKEKYVYIYRSDKTQVLNVYQYNDTDDLFAREPFVAQFTLPSKILPSVVLVPLHTTPKDVEKELNALYDVFLDVSQRWQNEDVILLGDFNADCASLTKKRLNSLLLRTEAAFRWVIPDGEDTTVRTSTNCTYDRIVMHGQGCQTLLRAAAPFNFPRSFQLTEEEALSISDHYPVEVELSRAAPSIQPLSLAILLSQLGRWLDTFYT